MSDTNPVPTGTCTSFFLEKRARAQNVTVIPMIYSQLKVNIYHTKWTTQSARIGVRSERESAVGTTLLIQEGKNNHGT